MKMLNLLKSALCGAAILLSFASYGQSFQGVRNVPLGVLPMQYNSSFAGESNGARFSSAMAYKNDIASPFNQQAQMFGSHLSYDQFIPALRSGIGISLNRESEWFNLKDQSNSRTTGGRSNIGVEGEVYHYRLSAAIAPKISIKGKYSFSPSIDFTFAKGKGESQLFIENQAGESGNFNTNRLQSRVGLLFNTDKYYLGISTYILDYSQMFSSRDPQGESRISRSTEWLVTWVQAGYTFQRSAESKFSFTPQIAYRISPTTFSGDFQTNSHILDAFNFTFRYDKFIGGFNNTGVHLGFQNEKLRFLLGTLPWSSARENPYRSNRFSPGVNDRNSPFSSANFSIRYTLK